MFDSAQTKRWIEEANDIVSMVSTVMSNEVSSMSSSDVYNIVEQLERARNLMLCVGDRKYLIEKEVA